MKISTYRDYRVDFLEFRLWIGVWIFALLTIFVVFNLSFLVKFITRFTEDCFASLVALIFIYDAIREIFKLRETYPVNYQPKDKLNYSCTCAMSNIISNITFNNSQIIANLSTFESLNKAEKMQCIAAGGVLDGSGCSTPEYYPDIFFYSVLLFIFTFFICMSLQEFRHSAFFPTKVS